MDIKQLLEKMDKFAGEKVGQKPGDQWKGTDKGTPGKKLVGDSILKDLSKGKKAKNKEQELSEEFQAFLEAEFQDTVDKRPARKSDRHPRGHEPHPRYKTVKADESAMGDKDIELQDYRSMSHKEFQTAYGMTKTEWISKNKSLVITNPNIKKGLGLGEAADTEYTVNMDRNGKTRSTSGTIAELLDYFGYTLEVGKSYEHEKGRYKINLNPKSIGQLVDALNKAASNGAANGAASTHYSTGGQMFDEAGNPAQQAAIAIAMKKAGKKPKNEGVSYKTANPHPASKDPIVAKVLKQMRPGLTGLDMNNEAFLYFAYEIGKMRAREMWEDYGPAIKHFYQSGIGVNEGWESGPEEYEEPYDDADDAYDRQRQEKIDTEAEKEWAKLPKVSTYQCTGRGANMEPNQKFGPEFDTLEQALEYRAEIMKDPKTPHPEHIGINTLTRVVDKEQTDEMVDTRQTPLVDKEDYNAKRAQLQKIQMDPETSRDPQLKAELARRMAVLMQQAKDMGIEESRAHKILNTWFKNHERQEKFAKGELTVPTPQERRAQLEKPKKQIKEFGANPPQGTAGQTMQQQDPKQAQAVAQATNTLKAATGSTAPTTNIAKALDSASQGNPVGGQDMKALEPLMKDVATIAQTPQLAGQLKTVLGQVQQVQQKQKQQQQQTT